MLSDIFILEIMMKKEIGHDIDKNSCMICMDWARKRENGFKFLNTSNEKVQVSSYIPLSFSTVICGILLVNGMKSEHYQKFGKAGNMNRESNKSGIRNISHIRKEQR
jgi:hypothetical protein